LAKDTRRRGDAARGGSDGGADEQSRGSTLWSNRSDGEPRTERGPRDARSGTSRVDEPSRKSDPSNKEERSPQAAFSEGSRFGPFVLGERIGSGGMARVYQAEHQGLRRQVAIKVLIDGFASDVEERFLREGRIAAAIKHPNVVNIFDVGLHQGLPYMVMELLEGEDLESLLRERGALDQETLIDIMVPILAGLAAVHDQGVVHRDLKPGNIFLAHGQNGEMEPKLLDFGISKAAWPESLKLTSANGVVLGTPFYMSPEGVQGQEMTELSDQYSLGVVLYECATGKNPFVTTTFAETVRRITSGDYPAASQEKPELSKRLARIIERAMHIDPSQRFGSVRELGRELLLLAGQRTRITWGLSFGDPGQVTHDRRTKPTRREPGPASAASLDRRQRHASILSLVLIAVGLVGMLSLGVVLVRRGTAPHVSDEPSSSEHALRPQAPPPVVAPLATPPLGTPENSPVTPHADLAARVRAAQPATQSAQLDEARDDTTRAPLRVRPARTEAAGQPERARVVKRAQGSRVEPARRRAAPTRTTTSAARDDGDEPGWWPPAREPAPEAPRRPPVGANNAPIFD
jgi:serine/threonine protein kinase